MNKKTEAEGAVSECSALLGGALGDVIAQYRDGDMSACADALLKIVWEFRELERDAARYRFLRDEDNWGDDSGDDCWERLGESHCPHVWAWTGTCIHCGARVKDIEEAGLPPCPFCGSAAILTAQGRHEFAVSCSNSTRCGIDGPARPSKISAIQAWVHRSSASNTRSSDA